MPEHFGRVTFPKVPKALIDEMLKVFPAPTIEVGYNHDKALWDAACHFVVQWLISKSYIDASTGDTGQLKESISKTPTGAVVRLGE